MAARRTFKQTLKTPRIFSAVMKIPSAKTTRPSQGLRRSESSYGYVLGAQTFIARGWQA
jgi:hypothetical protein